MNFSNPFSGPAFGLYPSRDLVPAQRLASGHTAALHRPVDADGVTLFRVSYWLPVPALVGVAQALRLAPAEFHLRFDATEFDLPLSDREWFPNVRTLVGDRLRIEFAWPATLVRINRPAGRDRRAVDLLRADGDAVAEKPAQSGITGVDLDPPWVGSPLVVEVGEVKAGLERVGLVAGGSVSGVVGGMRGGVRGGVGMASGVADKADTLASVGARSLVSGLRLAGRPTSPRLKLLAEYSAHHTLLWQALRPGDTAQATLPERAIDLEWADALEQVRAADGLPERLRLDIESDAPCRLHFTRLDLGLRAAIELLESPRDLAFEGDRVQSAALPLALPPGLAWPAACGLRLSGRVVADPQTGATSGPGPSADRFGALLTADRAALQPVDLAAPIALSGVALDWLPLSSALRLRVRLLADGGAKPGVRVLAETTHAGATPQATRLLLRWPALDLQPQRVWIEATLLEGAGLWPFDTDTDTDAHADAQVDPAASAGLLDTLGPTRLRQTLSHALQFECLAAPSEVAATRAIAVRLDGQVLADRLPEGAFEIDLPAPLLPRLATRDIVFEAGVRARLTLVSARLEVVA